MLPIDFQVTPFELHPEDGFIKMPKRVPDLIIFYIVKVVLD